LSSIAIPDGVTIGTAPDSWGVWFPDDPVQVKPEVFLDEAAKAGYEWIELGPYGYLPTDPSELRDALDQHGLKVTAGTVFEHLHRPDSWDHVASQVSDVAGLAKAVGAEYVVVIPSMWRDDVTGEEVEPYELDAEAWNRKIQGNDRLGKLILEEYGLHVVYHPHADSHIDNNAAIERFLDNTDPQYVNLCLDTGHLSYCGGDNLDLIAKRPDRITYTHLKQCDPAVKAVVDEQNLTWAAAVQLGVMSEPPGGVPDMPSLFAALEALDRPIFGIVEQDMYGCPTDQPYPIAQRTLGYLNGCKHREPR
jgi:inosose dehydratase